jgi:hypothetical protein
MGKAWLEYLLAVGVVKIMDQYVQVANVAVNMATVEHQAVTAAVNAKKDMENVIRAIVAVKLLPTADAEVDMENALVENAVVNMGTVEVALTIAHLIRDVRALTVTVVPVVVVVLVVTRIKLLLMVDVEVDMENALVENVVVNMGTVEVALTIAHLIRDVRVLMEVAILIVNQAIQKLLLVLMGDVD